MKAKADLRINPQGMVPALELDDGTVLTQNQATIDKTKQNARTPNPAREGPGNG